MMQYILIQSKLKRNSAVNVCDTPGMGPNHSLNVVQNNNLQAIFLNMHLLTFEEQMKFCSKRT